MKMKRFLALALLAISTSVFFAGYHSVLAEETEETAAGAPDSETAGTGSGECVLEDGIYSAEFNTDSSMFHVNEANEGRGILTVEEGKMTIHVSLVSKSILNLLREPQKMPGRKGRSFLNRQQTR